MSNEPQIQEGQIKSLIEDYSRQFEKNATPGIVIYHLIEQGLIPEKSVRNYNICRAYLKTRQGELNTTMEEIEMGLSIKYNLTPRRIRAILKEDLPKYDFI